MLKSKCTSSTYLFFIQHLSSQLLPTRLDTLPLPITDDRYDFGLDQNLQLQNLETYIIVQFFNLIQSI